MTDVHDDHLVSLHIIASHCNYEWDSTLTGVHVGSYTTFLLFKHMIFKRKCLGLC